MSRAFTPRTVGGTARPRRAIVEEHLDAVADQGGMDVIATLAYPLPVIIIAEMLGIPTEDHARFKHWSDEMVRGMGISTDEDDRAPAAPAVSCARTSRASLRRGGASRARTCSARCSPPRRRAIG